MHALCNGWTSRTPRDLIDLTLPQLAAMALPRPPSAPEPITSWEVYQARQREQLEQLEREEAEWRAHEQAQ